MARLPRSKKIDTRTARTELRSRSAPYFTSIQPGFSIGYRKGKTGGMWIARRLGSDGTYVTEALGVADDKTDRDGLKVLSFADAVDKAREWRLAALECPTSESFPTQHYTIGQALDDYVAHLKAKSSRGVRGTEGKINSAIRPALGSQRVVDLTAKRIAELVLMAVEIGV